MSDSDHAVLVAHQPAYLPWPGYVTRLLDPRVERLVLLDHVQFSQRGWQNRNTVADRRGRPTLLTVPVRHRHGQSILATPIAGTEWARRHWRTLSQHYGNAQYWPQFSDRLAAIYHTPWESLTDLNTALTAVLLDGFGVDLPMLRSASRARSVRASSNCAHSTLRLCSDSSTPSSGARLRRCWLARAGRSTRRHLDQARPNVVGRDQPDRRRDRVRHVLDSRPDIYTNGSTRSAGVGARHATKAIGPLLAQATTFDGVIDLDSEGDADLSAWQQTQVAQTEPSPKPAVSIPTRTAGPDLSRSADGAETITDLTPAS